MFRGSTPTHVFTLSIPVEEIQALRLTYVQGGKTVLDKTEADVKMSGATVTLRLTQEETLAFGDTAPVNIQLKVLTTDGAVLPSQIFRVHVDEILNEEVLE